MMNSKPPIAIVGMGCRFPGGASSVRKFWELLVSGTDAIIDVPADRWNIRRHFSADERKGKTVVARGGFLVEKIDEFDPLFFGISPREAESMDPQQRLLLEVLYEATEDAGLPLEKFNGSNTGVFIGGFTADNQLVQLSKDNRWLLNTYSSTGTTSTMLSSKLSYWFNLKGPAMTIDTACSSSLVAVHIGVQSIWNGECDIAVAGGVNVMLRPETTASLGAAKLLSKHGHCKAFDSDAGGYVRGEGAGIVLLKPVEQAIADGDRIYAVIHSTALNQDGKTNGITTPNAVSQKDLLKKIYEQSGIDINQLDYIEAHGTGTQVGDTIEFTTLNEILKESGYEKGKCLVGSVKTNIGHLEAGAGVAGLIKAALCLYNKQVPPNLHFNQPNPKLNYEDSLLKVPVQVESLSHDNLSTASINSFGYGGTNSHAILQEYKPEKVTEQEPVTGLFILPLSAQDPVALKQVARQYCAALESDEVQLEDMLYTAALRRTHHTHRIAICAESKEQLLGKLYSFINDIAVKDVVAGQANHTKQKCVFVYTGMGPQWWKMGRELMEKEPVFARAMEKFDRLFQSIASWSILEELKKDEEHSRIRETQFAQPGNFIIQYALTELLNYFGITPDAVAGHSVGEVASAYFSGALTLEDAVSVIYHRSRLQAKEDHKGRMLAVSYSEEEVSKLIVQYDSISIAAVNSPGSVTLSGDENVLLQLAEDWEMKGIFCRMLEVTVPYHSPVMEEIREELLESLQHLKPRADQIPLYSTVTGQRIDGKLIDANYWWQNVRQPVAFFKAVDSLSKEGYSHFIEIGPHPVLKNSISECLNEVKRKGELVHFMNRKEPEQSHFYTGLATLHTMGYPLAWDKLVPKGQLASLPLYPWQRSRYWNESVVSLEYRKGREGNVFLNSRLVSPSPAYEVEISDEMFPFLRDHVVNEKVIFPGAGYIAAGIALYQNEYPSHNKGFCLEDISFHQLLQADSQRTQLMHSTLHPGLRQFSIYSRYEDNNPAWQLRASGRFVEQALSPGYDMDIPFVSTENGRIQYADEVYSSLATRNLAYGPSFRVVKRIVSADDHVIAMLHADEAIQRYADDYFIHPVLLDGCFQAMVVNTSTQMVPVSIRRMNCYKPADNILTCVIRITKESDQEVTGDLSIINADGTLAIFIEGLKCRAVVTDMRLQEKDLSGTYYLPYWEDITDRVYDLQSEPVCFVLGQSSSRSVKLVNQLSDAGYPVVYIDTIGKADVVNNEQEEVDLFDKINTDQFVRRIAKAGSPLKIIYLAGLDERDGEDFSVSACNDVMIPLVNLVQSFAALEECPAIDLSIVTCHAQVVVEGDTGYSLMEAPLWGLASVIENEHAAFSIKLIDIDDESHSTKWIDEIFGGADESAVAIRNNKVFAKRLRETTSPSGMQQKKMVNTRESGVALRTGSSAGYKDLYYEEKTRKAPAADEIEIRVSDAGINFKDFLKVTGQISRKALEGTFFGQGLCMECAGIVTRAGDKVVKFKAGDRVLCINPADSFQSFITTTTKLVIHQPASLQQNGSHVMIAFLTMLHCLKTIARLTKGERILIHNATGAVGLAAIQYARFKGAEIFATAGNEEKRSYLRSIGVQHVYNSHDLQFVSEVMRDSADAGVDVVLSAMQGEALLQGMSLLAPYGRYIEIGKKDIVDNSSLPMQWFNRNLSFNAVDMDRMIREKPAEIAAYLKEIATGFEKYIYQPLPVKTFDAADISKAFELISNNAYIGKLVIDFRDQDLEVVSSGEKYGEGSTWLVTGGTKGLGLEVADWLSQSGKRNIVLAGRNKLTEAAMQKVNAMRKRGTQVFTEQVDIADAVEVKDLIQRIKKLMPPLKGIVHCAMVLDDGLLVDMTPDRFEKVLRPKCGGALNLHESTKEEKLDHFICISSISSLIGNPGQASYIAANSFLDAFAHYRRSNGLPASVINLGVLAETGVVARDKNIAVMLDTAGITGLSTANVMQALTYLISENPVQLGYFNIDWKTWIGANQHAMRSSLFGHYYQLADTRTRTMGKWDELVSLLTPMNSEDRYLHVRQLLLEGLSGILKMPMTGIDPDKGINLLGIDSVMVVELISMIRNNVGINMLPMEFLTGPSVNHLAEVIIDKLPASKTEAVVA